jgi:glycogen synthase
MAKLVNIVVASLLKPIDDSRMFAKIAKSLATNSDYHIHLVGQASELPKAPANLTFHPAFIFSRMDKKRLKAQVIYYKILLKVKPELIICNSPDLLPVTILYKIKFGCKIVYDVLENYYRNVSFTDTYPPVLRNLLAVSYRGFEIASRPFIDHYFLAEKEYENEFWFSKGKSTVLENKYAPVSTVSNEKKLANRDKFHLIYTGTIARSYGVFEAIALTKALHSIDNRIKLSIIGFAPDVEVLNELYHEIVTIPYIKVIGGNQIVPHSQIIEAMEGAGLALLPYHQDPHIKNCIPTKIYEYIANRVPMLIEHNPIWEEVCSKYDAAIFTNFSKTADCANLYDQAFAKEFYLEIANANFSEIYWHPNNHDALLAKVSELLERNN